jgi:transcriptional regulator with XRE-family HTH domain
MANTRGEKSLGEVIREARVAKGSLREYAKKLDITPSYMSDIENDRRIPAEDVLKNIARLLRLDFGDLMARAGRFGDNAERYMRRHPTAGVLFRQISEANLADDDLVKLLEKAEELGRKRDQER